MPTVNIRFKGLVGTTAQLNTDRFAGRIGYDTTKARFVVSPDGTNWSESARRDVAEVFSSTVSAAGLIDTTATSYSGRVLRYGASGALTSDAGMTTTQAGGITSLFAIGEGSVASNTGIRIVRTSTSYYAYLEFANGPYKRWRVSFDSSDEFRITAYTSAGALIDSAITIVNAAGGIITLGGDGGTKRDVNLTKDLRLAATTRITSGGAGTLVSLLVTGLAGTGYRSVAADASGNLVVGTSAANIYVRDGSTPQSFPTGTGWTKSTAFTTDGISVNATAAAANDKITLTRAGTYEITYTSSISSGTANVTAEEAIRIGGTVQDSAIAKRVFATSNALVSTALSTVVTVGSAPVDVDVVGRHDNGGSVDITIVHASLAVHAI